MALQGDCPFGILKTATSRKPELEFPSISMFNGPEVVICRIMYPIFGPKKSRQELTYGPGVTNVKGPAVPEAQIEVLVLHCALAD